MKRLLFLDGNNYTDDMPEIKRTAVRGIIDLDGKLLFIKDKFGALKLPGGGQEEGESNEQTLAREVLEETGYTVDMSTVMPFGYIEEKRRSTHEKDTIWHQFNYLYFCSVTGERGECSYSDSEKDLGMQLAAHTLDEAIEINRSVLEREGRHEWNQREYNTLMLIKEHTSN